MSLHMDLLLNVVLFAQLFCWLIRVPGFCPHMLQFCITERLSWKGAAHINQRKNHQQMLTLHTPLVYVHYLSHMHFNIGRNSERHVGSGWKLAPQMVHGFQFHGRQQLWFSFATPCQAPHWAFQSQLVSMGAFHGPSLSLELEVTSMSRPGIHHSRLLIIISTIRNHEESLRIFSHYDPRNAYWMNYPVRGW